MARKKLRASEKPERPVRLPWWKDPGIVVEKVYVERPDVPKRRRKSAR